jgi:hypothetical protein
MSEVVATSTVEITPPGSLTLTKEEIRKQKNRDYQREYMKKYYHERSAVDSEYLEKHRESARKAVAKQRAKYKEAFDFVKNNNISVKA